MISYGFPACWYDFAVTGDPIRLSRIEIPVGDWFSEISISIGSWLTNGVSRWMEVRIDFPASIYPSGTGFQKSRFPLVPGRPMGFRGERTPDSNSSAQITLGQLQNAIRFCLRIWFSPINWWSAVTRASRHSLVADFSFRERKQNKRNELFFFSKNKSSHFRTFLLK